MGFLNIVEDIKKRKVRCMQQQQQQKQSFSFDKAKYIYIYIWFHLPEGVGEMG